MSEIAVYRVTDDELVVTPFEDDLDLLSYLRLPDDAVGRQIVARYTPELRYQLARLRAIADALNDGVVPRVVLARRRPS